MMQSRKNKIIMIMVLCISVVGLTLGFAAFSNMLTISSSATVSPNRSDFKLVAYGIDDASIFDEDFVYYGKYSWPELYTSDSISKAFVRNLYLTSSVSGLDAKIESNVDSNGVTSISLSNLHANITDPYDEVFYNFLIKNEGNYDAYLSPEQFDDLVGISKSIVCEPVIEDGKASATESLVDAACDSINVQLDVIDENNHLMSNAGVQPSGAKDIKISKYGVDNEYGYGYVIVCFSIKYESGLILADGDFTAKIPDINLQFSTVAEHE